MIQAHVLWMGFWGLIFFVLIPSSGYASKHTVLAEQDTPAFIEKFSAQYKNFKELSVMVDMKVIDTQFTSKSFVSKAVLTSANVLARNQAIQKEMALPLNSSSSGASVPSSLIKLKNVKSEKLPVFSQYQFIFNFQEKPSNQVSTEIESLVVQLKKVVLAGTDLIDSVRAEPEWVFKGATNGNFTTGTGDVFQIDVVGRNSKRLNPIELNSPFKGSHVLVEDLIFKPLNQYHFKYVRSDFCAAGTCSIISRIAARPVSANRDEYQNLWIDPKDYRLVKIEYFKSGILTKTVSLSGFVKFQQRYWLPTVIEIVPSDMEPEQASTLFSLSGYKIGES